MRKQSYDYEAALKMWYGESIFAAYELEKLDITGLLWQTGYLTIKDIREDAFGMLYRLDFPDREVQSTFTSRLIKTYAGSGAEDELLAQMRAFGQAINNDDLSDEQLEILLERAKRMALNHYYWKIDDEPTIDEKEVEKSHQIEIH